MDRRRVLLIAAAVVAALGTVLVLVYVQGADNRARDAYETTEVLVASIRGPIHVIEAARMGADVCTCPPKAIEALFNHPLTEIGLEKFLADWAQAQQPA